MATKKFRLEVILMLITKTALSPEHAALTLELMEFLTGRARKDFLKFNAVTVASLCIERLLSQHPVLREVSVKGLTKHNYGQWLKNCEKKYGRELEIESEEISELQICGETLADIFNAILGA